MRHKSKLGRRKAQKVAELIRLSTQLLKLEAKIRKAENLVEEVTVLNQLCAVGIRASQLRQTSAKLLRPDKCQIDKRRFKRYYKFTGTPVRILTNV